MEMARARQKRSEKERKNGREKREESKRGERERSVCRKGGTTGGEKRERATRERERERGPEGVEDERRYQVQTKDSGGN